MIRWKRLVPSGSLIGNVAVLFSGAVIAKALTVVVAPVLSRLYGPAEYGLLGTFATLAMLLGRIAALRFDLAIVLPKTDDEAIKLLAVGGLAVGAVSLLSLAIVLGGHGVLADLLQAPELGDILWLLPLTVAVIGVWQVLVGWGTRTRQFPAVSTGQVARSGGTIFFQVGAGVAGSGAVGLAGGQAAGQAIGSMLLAWQLIRKGTLPRLPKLVVKDLWTTVKRYHDFPLYSVPQSALNSFSHLMPVLVLGRLFGPIVVGLYWFTHRLLQLPADLIGQAVRSAYFQRASELRGGGRSVLPSMLRATGLLAALGVLPGLVLVVWGESLFAWVFGSQWQAAGVYAGWLAINWFVWFISPPSVVLIHTFRFQKSYLCYEIISLACKVGALVWGASLGSAVVAIAAYAVVSSLLLVILILGAGILAWRSETAEGIASAFGQVLPRRRL